MKKVTSALLAGAASLAFASLAFAQAPVLNEIVMNDISTDDHEFVEICGEPFTDLSAFTVVVIEGEGTTARGTIDRAFQLTGLIGASGFYVLGDPAITCADQVKGQTLENGGETILLVRNFTGSVGMDIDADDDGVEDGPIGLVVDAVATQKPSSGDAPGYYGAVTLGPDTGNDGTADFDVAGVARCEDCTGGWGMICLAGTEPTGTGCDINNAFNPYNVTYASPCSGNLCAPISVDPSSWGKVKSDYR